MLMWIWIAVVVLGLLVLGLAAGRLLGRLGGLHRAAVRLQRRQADAAALQQEALALEQTVAGLQERLDTLAERRPLAERHQLVDHDPLARRPG